MDCKWCSKGECWTHGPNGKGDGKGKGSCGKGEGSFGKSVPVVKAPPPEIAEERQNNQMLMEMLMTQTGCDHVEAFVAFWGLDHKCQEVLSSLDADTQKRIINGFQPKDMTRANPMFMGFVKSVAGVSGAPRPQTVQMLHTAPTMQMLTSGGELSAVGGAGEMFVGGGGGGSEMFTGGGETIGGNANFDSIEAFVAYWGLDTRCMQTLYGLDPGLQQRIMSGFSPPDMSRANQTFMGFVRSVAGTSGLPTTQQPLSGVVGTIIHSPDQFIAQWGLDTKCHQVLLTLDPEVQQRIMNGFNPKDPSRANQMFMGFVKSVGGTLGSATSRQAFGAGGGTLHSPASFVAQWGLDAKCQEVLLSLDADTQQRVMNGFQPKDLARANQMFMGFVKSVSSGSGRTSAAQQGLNDLGSILQAAAAAVSETVVTDGSGVATGGFSNQNFEATGGFSNQSFEEQLGQLIAQPNGTIDMSAFVAQWGLDQKCQSVLLSLDPSTQQRVMSGFQPKDLSRANQMFMGFVKSVSTTRFSPY